ncbi:hypothetical protein L3Q82_007961 [Scortum barcoo]|uniref:Uncharacterized protein n=1 Tax=Scortum barcoo TaxID=214431 RepID=A0ACB8WKJ8_9TELE|nr:hypothetical protein L3Q82_007961 [Scortum barcoo]
MFSVDAHGEDIDSLTTHCLTDYINFCVENTVPTRTFVSGNKEELKSVQRELRRMIRKGKNSCYRRKMEHQLQQNKHLWSHTHPWTLPVHCGIFGYTFNLSLSLELGRVPQLWKTSCIVPVPKTPHPKELNSYRPVALMSHLMKTLERLVLVHLRPLVSSFMDPLQFAYQPDIGVDDAVIYLLHTSLTHLEKAGSTVRIMFFDFSSAFNTIQPRLLWDKLQLASWGGPSPHFLDSGLPHSHRATVCEGAGL